MFSNLFDRGYHIIGTHDVRSKQRSLGARWMRYIGSVLLIFPALLLLKLAASGTSDFSSLQPGGSKNSGSQVHPDPPPGNRRLVVIAEATKPSTDVCKLVSSAIALGYPSPVLLHWGQTFDAKHGWFGGQHLSKIVGVLEYLDYVTRNDTHEGYRLNDDDLVMFLDGYDVWLQLGPDVLLQRYHQANKEANARLAEQWPGPGIPPMQQTVIWSAGKKCWPTRKLTDGTLIHCDALPESPLRDDLYGPKTDQDRYNDTGVFYSRPKFVNSGSVLGPAGDMKRFFRRTKERMDRAQAGGYSIRSDQGLFGAVMGEQEIFRNWLRESPELVQHLPAYENDSFMFNNYEYKVGLDYARDLFVPTSGSPKDGAFITLNNKTAIAEHSAALNISVRLDGVPKDIQDSHNPLQDIAETANIQVPQWGDMPLYADFFTAATSVVVHHNEIWGGLKKRRIWWWNKTWYFPYLRMLLKKAREPAPLKPLATIPVEGGEVVYWPPKSDENTVKGAKRFRVETRKEGLEELDFQTICQDPEPKPPLPAQWWDEVFRDGKGPL